MYLHDTWWTLWYIVEWTEIPMKIFWMEEQQQKNKIMLNSKAKYGVNVVDCGWTCNVYPIFVIWSKRHCQAFVGYIGSIELAVYALVSTVLLRFANRILVQYLFIVGSFFSFLIFWLKQNQDTRMHATH